MNEKPVIHITIAPVSFDLVVNDAWHHEARKTKAIYEAGPELLAILKKVTFIAEHVAHLRGLEREILPTTDQARALIDRLES